MIRKADIVEAARSVVRHNRGYRLPVLIHPQRDWWIGLMLFSGITLVGSLFMARLYFINQSLEGIVGVEGDAIPRYREEVVADVLDLYQERNAAYQAALGAIPVAPPVAATTTETLAATAIGTSTEETISDTELNISE